LLKLFFVELVSRKSGSVGVGGKLREIDDASAEEAARRVRMARS